MPSSVTFTITRTAPPSVIAQELVEPMRKLGNGIARRAQRIVPKDTWSLHDSINTQTALVGGEVVTTVGMGGGDVDYGLFVEEGTSRQRAQPFMRPAMLQSNASDFGVAAGPVMHGRVSPARNRGRAARSARGKGKS